MGFYERWILPPLIDRAMRHRDLAAYRRRLARRARGRVLEIGVGSGLNLPLYGSEVACIVGLDPSPELLKRAAALVGRTRRPVHLLRAAAEALPLRTGSIDTIVMTWTLCSIGDAQRGLAEMRRVLQSGGELLFVEHGLAPDPRVAAWQHRLDPLWTRVSCRLENPVADLLRDAGFEIMDLETGYLGTGPKPMTFMYEGRARSRAATMS